MPSNTPRGKGLHSRDFEDGTRRKGTDGRWYVSRGNVWRLVSPQKTGKWVKKTSRGDPGHGYEEKKYWAVVQNLNPIEESHLEEFDQYKNYDHEVKSTHSIYDTEEEAKDKLKELENESTFWEMENADYYEPCEYSPSYSIAETTKKHKDYHEKSLEKDSYYPHEVNSWY